MPLLCTYRLNWATRTPWPPDECFEIQTLVVWGWAHFFSVTKAPHNTELQEWMRKKHFCFFQTAMTVKRTPNSSVKGSDANRYPRAPTQWPGYTCLSFLFGRFRTSSQIEIGKFPCHLYLLFFLMPCMQRNNSRGFHIIRGRTRTKRNVY